MTVDEQVHYVCAISYFDYLDEKRNTIDTYFQNHWNNYRPYFLWDYQIHFFINPENTKELDAYQIKNYANRIDRYNKTHHEQR